MIFYPSIEISSFLLCSNRLSSVLSVLLFIFPKSDNEPDFDFSLSRV